MTVPDREALSDQGVCPVCGETGPEVFDPAGDYGGSYEARCGDDWHDDKTALPFDEEAR